MPCEREPALPDFGLVATISLPPESLLPDPATGASGTEEYGHFRIGRAPADLQEWSLTCVDVTQKALDDLRDNGSELDESDEKDLPKGFLVRTQAALTRWTTAVSGTGQEARATRTTP